MAANRSIARLLRVLRAAIAIAVVGSVAFAARLAHGPIDLALMKPMIESALSDAFAGGDVTANRIILRAGEGRLAAVAFGVEVASADGAGVIKASRVEIAIDPQALMVGDLRPSRVDLLNTRITAVRGADGALRLDFAMAETPDESAEPQLDLVATLRAWMDGRQDLGDLPEITLRSANLRAIDETTGETLWEGVADAGATLSPVRALIWSEIKLDAERSTAPISLSATLARGENADAAITFDQADLLVMGKIARLAGAEVPLIEGSLSGSAAVTLDSGLEPLGAQASLVVKDMFGAFPGGVRINVDEAVLEARIDAQRRMLHLSGVRLGSNGAGLVGAATVKETDDDAYVVSGRLDHASLGYIVRLAGQETAAAGLDAAFTVDFDLEIIDGTLADAEARIVADGRVDRPEMFYEPILVDRAEGFVAYSAAGRALSLKGLDIDVAGVQIAGEAAAVLTTAGDVASLDAQLRTGAFTADVLPKLWPKTFSAGGRAWVERNLLKGEVSGADIRISKPVDEDIAVVGELAASGVEIRYWDAMPLATGVEGTGRIEGNTLSFDITKGGSAGLWSNKVRVDLVDLGSPSEYIAIDGHIAGPASKLLAALDRKPLGYAKWLGVTPSETKGAVQGRLKLRFPLIDQLSIDDLQISATGTAKDALLPGVVKGWDLHADAMSIDVDVNRLLVEGAGHMLDEPLNFKGALQFGPGDERARFTGDWRLTRDVRRALGLGAEAVRRRLTGVTPAKFDVSARSDRLYEIGFDADLTAATLLAQEVGWLKPKGAPAKISALAVIKDDAPVRIDDIRLTAPDFSLTADVSFDLATGAVSKVAVRRLLGVGHDLAADVALSEEGDQVRVYGRRADLRPLMDLNRSERGQTAPEQKSDSKPRRFEIDVAEARLSENMRLTRVKADVTLIDDWPILIRGDAEYLGGLLTVAPSPEADDVIQLNASDFGKLLSAAALTDGILGGAAVVQISRRGDEGYGLEGRVNDFDFAKAEIEELAGDSAKPLLTLLGGGDAVRFDRLDLFARYKDGLFTIDKGRAAGAALGMSARGGVDLKARTIDVTGAIAPAYGISRVIGEIPILGDILTGSRKEGVFAANYWARGDLDNPSFRIDGFSALAPGIIREALPAPGQRRRTQPAEEGDDQN